MIDLERAGVIGRYADHAISMVGSISMFDELATDVVPQIMAQCRALEVDVLLVVPYCPQRDVAAAVLRPGDRKARRAHDQPDHALQAGAVDETSASDIPRLPPRLQRRTTRRSRPTTGHRPSRYPNRHAHY